MSKLYGVYWDNGEDYEDHARDIYAICKTEELANKLADKLTQDLELASDRALENTILEGSFENLSDILKPWNKIGIYNPWDMNTYTFYVKELDYYDSEEEL